MPKSETGNTGSALQRGLSADNKETTYETCLEEPDGQTCRVKLIVRKKDFETTQKEIVCLCLVCSGKQGCACTFVTCCLAS